MTCKEKLKLDHPEWDDQLIQEISRDQCPNHFGYYIDTGLKDCCPGLLCENCWDKELSEEETEITSECFEEDGYSPKIKDSGDRTEFETGAVRDMRTGKGRCDLMPLEVVGNYISPDNESSDWVLWCIRNFQKTESTSYLYSAINRFDQIHWKNPFTMFLEVAKHFEEGAAKYGPDNWKRGIPTWCYIDSAIRHYLKWLRGDNDEPHDRAFVWNLMCCIWEVDHSPRAQKEGSGENHRQ